MTDIKRYGYTLPITREMALDVGLMEPTADERAERERQASEYRRVEAEGKARMDDARRQLADLIDPLARKILDLHCENKRGECEGCEFSGYEAERPDWPCATVEAVAEHYDIRVV